MAHLDIADMYIAFVGFQEVENEAEQGGLSRSVIAHQAENLARVDGVTIDIEYGACAVYFLQVCDCYFHVFSFLFFTTDYTDLLNKKNIRMSS